MRSRLLPWLIAVGLLGAMPAILILARAKPEQLRVPVPVRVLPSTAEGFALTIAHLPGRPKAYHTSVNGVPFDCLAQALEASSWFVQVCSISGG